VQKNPISTGFFPERREILEVGFVSDMEEFSFSNSFFQQSSLMANAIVPKKKWGTWWGKKMRDLDKVVVSKPNVPKKKIRDVDEVVVSMSEFFLDT